MLSFLIKEHDVSLHSAKPFWCPPVKVCVFLPRDQFSLPICSFTGMKGAKELFKVIIIVNSLWFRLLILMGPLVKDNKVNDSKQTYNIFMFHFRGKMIPSDLERRILEAKQKVSFCREFSPAPNKLRGHISVSVWWTTHFGFLLNRELKPQPHSFNENMKFCIHSIFISLSCRLYFWKV